MIIHELSNEHRQRAHIPRVLLSTREELLAAQKDWQAIKWSNILKDDPLVKTSLWYQEAETPRTSPGPNDWWYDVRKIIKSREALLSENSVTKAALASRKRKRMEGEDKVGNEEEMYIDGANDEKKAK